MHTNTFLRLFPVPKYLSQPVVGLDISEQSVKFIKLKSVGKRLSLDSYGGVKIPIGLINNGRIVNKEELKNFLIDFRIKHQLKEIAVSLPEEQAFVVNMTLPSMKRSELRESIELALDQHVPLPVPEVVFDYEILKYPKNNQDDYSLGVSVMPREMVEGYFSLLCESGFRPMAFEIEAQAQARSLIGRNETGKVLLVDVGRLRAGFAVVIDGVVSFTSTVSNLGGEDITKSITKHLGISKEEADRLKVEKGLLRSGETKELFYSIVPVISALADEIRRVKDYIRTHRGSEQTPNKIILTGGQSTLIGLDSYLSVNLEMEVEVGNTWKNVFSFQDEIPEIDFNNSGRYATAVGLALRNYD